MQICWKKSASERPHFELIIEILNHYLEHLRRDSVSSECDSDEGTGNFDRQGSKKSKNSSIRSGKGGLRNILQQGHFICLNIGHFWSSRWFKDLLFCCIHRYTQSCASRQH